MSLRDFTHRPDPSLPVGTDSRLDERSHDLDRAYSDIVAQADAHVAHAEGDRRAATLTPQAQVEVVPSVAVPSSGSTSTQPPHPMPGSSAGSGKSSTDVGSDDVSDEKSRRTYKSLGASLLFHLIALLVMACILLPVDNVSELLTILGNTQEFDDQDELVTVVLPAHPEEREVEPEQVDIPAEPAVELMVELMAKEAPPAITAREPDAAAPIEIDIRSELSGRTKAGRRALLKKFGGNAASEKAVRMGLEWLARHQNYDGSWSFAHHINDECVASCTQPGSYRNCQTAATGMALLCFLGHGDTHEQGEYDETVARGLYYLIRNMNVTRSGGDLFGTHRGNGRMYAHGLATIALCEAYGMSRNKKYRPRKSKKIGGRPRSKKSGEKNQTEKSRQSFRERTARNTKKRSQKSKASGRKRRTKKKKKRKSYTLKEAAQLAIDYVEYAQDPRGGGWRYAPRRPGDTSVVGWQLMALQSARASRLKVTPEVLRKAERFLETVGSNYGSRYGYTLSENGGQATTAIGLLCRMYLGWQHDNASLGRGVNTMSAWGPARNNMYYNYYATQVMHHWGGKPWKKWNAVMRDQLVDTQVRVGHARGSWNKPLGEAYGAAGGRLYVTCMSIMTLEVYYRHLPLYQSDALNDL